MLRIGVLAYNNKITAIYEIDEPGFYRIDFIKEGAKFQTEPDSVIYSQVQKKTTRVYGDSEIYKVYLDTITAISSANMSRDVKDGWEDGKFVCTEDCVNEKLGYKYLAVSVNGVVMEQTYTTPDVILKLNVTDHVYGVKMDPLNFSEYKLVSIDRNTVVSDSTDMKYYPLDTLKRRYDIEHIEDKDYVVVQSEEAARYRLKRWLESKSDFKSCDTETTGLDVDIYGEDELVGIILSEDVNTATYFPYRHKLFWNMPRELLNEVMEAIQSQEDKLVGANIKFDRKVFLKEGYDIVFKWDVTQLSIVHHPFLEKGVHTLKQRASEANGKFFLELEHIFVNKSDIDFSILPIDIVKYYACPDGTNTLEVLYMLLNKIPKYQWKLAQIESMLANVKADMEYYGMRVNVRKYEKQYRNCNYIMDSLLKAFRVLSRSDCNLNSTAELSDLIYNKMGCEVLSRTDKGMPSTNTLALHKLASEQRSDEVDPVDDITDMYGNVIISGEKLSKAKYPALVILSKYREYVKLQTSFYARFERTMRTGRVFFWVNQNGAASGRQSSPMHQLPPELKAIMLSDSVDHDMWGPDFSQIEIRMIAYLAGETDLIDKCCDPDNDIHRVIGSLISGKEMWAITPEERNSGKRRNFGFVYLISGFGLAKQIYNTPRPSRQQVEHAQGQLDALFHRFKRINRYIKQNAAKVQKDGYMETAWFHRKRYFKDIFDPDIEPRRKSSILRMANNMPVQGTAADYLKVAEVKMFQYIRKRGWNKLQDGFPLVRIMLSIHDEILISSHRSIPKEEIVAMIRSCMETPVDGAPPFFVQPALMDNWEGHSDDSLAMPIRLRDSVAEDYMRDGTQVFFSDVYDVDIPDELKAPGIDEDTASSELIKRIKLTLRGDTQRVADVTDADRYAAYVNYLDFHDMKYVKTNYREYLEDYRKKTLRNYMHDLINKYGTDYTVVGQHVRHPSLTHELLGAYKKKLSKLGLSHEEAITMATKFYIEDLGDTETDVTSDIVLPPPISVRSDKDASFEYLESLVNIDSNGEVIYEESSSTDDDYEYMTDLETDLESYRLGDRVPYVWELADSILVDVQSIKSQDDVNRVLAKMNEYKDDNGFYRTFIIYDGRAIDTGIKTENMDITAVNEYIYDIVDRQ